MQFRPVIVSLALVLAGCGVAQRSVAVDTVNPLLGQWARSSADCARAELTFTADKASIQLDADGTPTTFDYPEPGYGVGDTRVDVDLKTPHPFSKTASKTALQFQLAADGSASLQLLKGKSIQFVRCTGTTAH